MTPQEAVMLCRLTQACCPHQKIDQYTPDVWADLLSDIRYADAEVAVKAVARKQAFVSPSEIRAEVRRLRSDRIAKAVPVEPPADLDPDDVLAYRRWLSGALRDLGDGIVPPKREGLEKRDMRAIEGTFRRVPRVRDADTEEGS